MDQAMRKRDPLEAGVWGAHRPLILSVASPLLQTDLLTPKAESGAHMQFFWREDISGFY